ncbi:HD domain-containing phosphohydrolase [Aestuariivirga litoralis]|uniref:HD domain-containing phosphohydrolase n=1 Tax=Aestuariivirga litoralis TaxID=2650924 RepID=UPI0018C51C83|nr:HD domain-containing phosphohydrolase [Aestuariivirga litoralis]MBG1232559.1 HD domain-containing protein [Aestuariivirga litoralis]
MQPAQITQRDLMVALSRATDLATGRALGFAMKAAGLADRLARRAGLDEAQRQKVFQQGMLRYIGCNSETHAMAALLGDEISFRRDFALIDNGKPGEVIPLVWKHLRLSRAGQPPLAAFLQVLKGLAASKPESERILSGHCEVAQRLGKRLGFDDEACAALGQLYARWDGKGIPAELKGEAIALPVRIVTLAQDAVVLQEAFGAEGAAQRIQVRSGKAYDPRLAALLLQDENALKNSEDDRPPSADGPFSGEALNDALLAMADFIDIKTPHTMGHSRQLAALVAAAAKVYGLPKAPGVLLEQAALLHDIGQAGVPARVMMKNTAHDAGEREAMRLHTYYGARILAESGGLKPLAQLVSEHHERLDGSGYHNGARAQALSAEARLLAAAEAYQNKIEPRPHRAALTATSAAAALEKEARDGKLDADAVKAVLTAAGQPSFRPNRKTMELTPRELETLRCLCRGMSMKEAARALGISPKTVDNHIQAIHAKTGVRTRGGLILHALEQGWVGLPET